MRCTRPAKPNDEKKEIECVDFWARAPFSAKWKSRRQNETETKRFICYLRKYKPNDMNPIECAALRVVHLVKAAS